MNDPETHGIIMIGEIGGNLEAEAGNWIKENNGTLPVQHLLLVIQLQKAEQWVMQEQLLVVIVTQHQLKKFLVNVVFML